MPPVELISHLRCPICRCALEETGDDRLRCSSGHDLPITAGVVEARVGGLDAITERTVASFGYEWTTFDQVNPEDREFWSWYFADVDLDSLGDRIALDAGCGKGRYSTFTAEHVRGLVALDASDAVVAAAVNLAHHDNVLVVRGDLRDPPLVDASFGFVSCLGVLHHLEDPRAGFDRLVRLLEPGGLILLYLYSAAVGNGMRAVGLRGATALRRFTVRLPHPVLRALSAPIAAVLYALFVLPGRLGGRHFVALDRLPLGTYRGKPPRSLWLDTFDRLSAPIEHRMHWADLEPWFAGAGLDVLATRDDAGWFVLGRRPDQDRPTTLKTAST